jgi:squalene-hopene/tetraprenyl-beta-curcumene cyclase
MQSRNGGWGAFDADNDAMWLYRIPFCDFGKVTDEPSADVTAHVLEALGPERTYGAAVDRGLREPRRLAARHQVDHEAFAVERRTHRARCPSGRASFPSSARAG